MTVIQWEKRENIYQRMKFRLAKKLIQSSGFEIKRSHSKSIDFHEKEKKIIEFVKPFTGTGSDRILALIDSVRYITKNDVQGAIVECGVWKGGSIMAAALTLMECKKLDKDIYLFDTFEGMSKPGKEDINFKNISSFTKFEKTKITDSSSNWKRVGIDEVKHAVFSTGYPQDKFHFVKGMVENTLPSTSPELISILRLDTDWYESTKHELIHLFPLLSKGGILIIDDYGHHQGAKKAVDEYFEETKNKILLIRIDYTGRIGIKL